MKQPFAQELVVKAYANEALGEAYYYLQNLDSAKIAYTNALLDYQAVGNQPKQATQYNNLGLIDYYQGKYGMALENYHAIGFAGEQGCFSWHSNSPDSSNSNSAKATLTLLQR